VARKALCVRRNSNAGNPCAEANQNPTRDLVESFMAHQVIADNENKNTIFMYTNYTSSFRKDSCQSDKILAHGYHENEIVGLPSEWKHKRCDEFQLYGVLNHRHRSKDGFLSHFYASYKR